MAGITEEYKGFTLNKPRQQTSVMGWRELENFKKLIDKDEDLQGQVTNNYNDLRQQIENIQVIGGGDGDGGVKTKAFLVKDWVTKIANRSELFDTGDIDLSAAPQAVVHATIMEDAGINSPEDIVGFSVIVKIKSTGRLEPAGWNDYTYIPEIPADFGRWFNVAVSPNNTEYKACGYDYWSGTGNVTAGKETMQNMDNNFTNNFVAWLDCNFGGSAMTEFGKSYDEHSYNAAQRTYGIMLRCWRPCVLDIIVTVSYVDGAGDFFN